MHATGVWVGGWTDFGFGVDVSKVGGEILLSQLRRWA